MEDYELVIVEMVVSMVVGQKSGDSGDSGRGNGGIGGYGLGEMEEGDDLKKKLVYYFNFYLILVINNFQK